MDLKKTDGTKRISHPAEATEDLDSEDMVPVPQAKRSGSVPTIVRVGQWTAARHPSIAQNSQDGPAMSLADSSR